MWKSGKINRHGVTLPCLVASLSVMPACLLPPTSYVVEVHDVTSATSVLAERRAGVKASPFTVSGLQPGRWVGAHSCR